MLRRKPTACCGNLSCGCTRVRRLAGRVRRFAGSGRRCDANRHRDNVNGHRGNVGWRRFMVWQRRSDVGVPRSGVRSRQNDVRWLRYAGMDAASIAVYAVLRLTRAVAARECGGSPASDAGVMRIDTATMSTDAETLAVDAGSLQGGAGATSASREAPQAPAKRVCKASNRDPATPSSLRTAARRRGLRRDDVTGRSCALCRQPLGARCADSARTSRRSPRAPQAAEEASAQVPQRCRCSSSGPGIPSQPAWYASHPYL